jgi:tripartite-type tricarboxylate transporter receptor subunit TctC
MKNKKFGGVLLTTAVAAVFSASAMAQSYPERAIEWVVPAPAGGGTDTAARQLAQLVEKELGQSIAILNVAGGGGAVGMSQFVQARPDGYTLAAIWNGPITTVPNVQQVPYSIDDFRPIISTSETAYVMCVSPDFPADTGKEFLQELQDNPDTYTYGNDGIGGTMQLAAERLFRAFDASAAPIPFGGAGETLQNFLGGHIDIYGGSITPVLPYVEDGQAKCLIVTSQDPVPALPGASSVGELGHPELATSLWRAILGPKDMTDEKVNIVADAVEVAMQDESYLAFLKQQGEWPMVYRGEELVQFVQSEFESLGEVASSLGLKK